MGVELVDEDQEQGKSNFQVIYFDYSYQAGPRVPWDHSVFSITWAVVVLFSLLWILEGGKWWQLQLSEMLQ